MVEAKKNGASIATYGYDAAGRRITRAVVSPALTRDYIYLPDGRMLTEADGTGATVREYIWLGNLPIAIVNKTGATMTTYYVHAGHLNQPLVVTDGAKTKVWDATLEAFGAARIFTSTVEMNLRLPGQYFHAESALAQNWMRDYDPSLGRFIQTDPIGLEGGPNVYGYVGQDPLNAVDPDGQDIIVLRAPSEAGGFGHVGMLTGNERTGFTYGSVDGVYGGGLVPVGPSISDYGQYATTDQFFAAERQPGQTYGQRFPDAYRIPATPQQDQAALIAFLRSSLDGYNVVPNTANCHDAVSNALQAAGIPTPRGDVWPNQFYGGLRGGAPVRQDGGRPRPFRPPTRPQLGRR